MKAFSIDLRQRILDAYDAGEGTRQQIADRFTVSLGLVKKLLAQRKATGSIAPKPRPGRPAAFSGESLERLEAYVRQRPDATLEEIRQHFAGEVQCSIVAVHNALKRLDWRCKKNATRQRAGSSGCERAPGSMAR
jgi:transposase